MNAVARSCNAKNSGASRLCGFTLIELLVVIAIISILATILLPSLKKAQDLAKSVTCQNNQRAVGVSMQIYASEYVGYAPPSACSYFGYPFWDQFLVSFAGADPGVFACPEKAEKYPDLPNYLGR